MADFGKAAFDLASKNNGQIGDLSKKTFPNGLGTFTISKTSTLPNKVVIEPSNASAVLDKRFLYTGGAVKHSRIIANGSYIYAVNNANNPAPSRQHSFTAHFMHFGQSLEFRIVGLGKYRISVDGIPLTETFNARPSDVSTGDLFYVKVDFNDARHRLMTIELADSQFDGVHIGATDSIYVPVNNRKARAVALGDSVTQGQNVDDSPLTIWPTYLAKELKWDVWDQGEGGTGWINPGPLNGDRTFQARIPEVVTPWNPDVIIFAGGLNDKSNVKPEYTPAALLAKVTATLSDAKAAAPNAEIFVVGPFFTGDTSTTGQELNIEVHDVLKNAAQQASVNFIDTKGYITNANKGIFISNDGIHPLKSGQEFWGRILASEIAKKTKYK